MLKAIHRKTRMYVSVCEPSFYFFFFRSGSGSDMTSFCWLILHCESCRLQTNKVGLGRCGVSHVYTKSKHRDSSIEREHNYLSVFLIFFTLARKSQQNRTVFLFFLFFLTLIIHISNLTADCETRLSYEANCSNVIGQLIS